MATQNGTFLIFNILKGLRVQQSVETSSVGNSFLTKFFHCRLKLGEEKERAELKMGFKCKSEE